MKTQENKALKWKVGIVKTNAKKMFILDLIFTQYFTEKNILNQAKLLK